MPRLWTIRGLPTKLGVVKSELRSGWVVQDPPSQTSEELFYVTALSNFVRGYDKYARTYDKSKIPESTFPSRFFLLRRGELSIGIAKARHLPRKTGLPGDRLIAIQTHAGDAELHANARTGLGRYVDRGHIAVDALHWVDPPARMRRVLIEEAVAASLRAWTRGRPRFETLAPRSVSILPVARACTADCPFCFSKASASKDTTQTPLDWSRIVEVLRVGNERGASRAVLTGGGEPSLLRGSDLLRLIHESAILFPKVVLISNGWKWGHMEGEERERDLRALERAGLSVLALSRHHSDSARNAALMGVDTRSEQIAATWSSSAETWPRLKLRWICVLQRGEIEDRSGLEMYLDWAVSSGVEEICFKELYVSTSIESEYHDRTANEWSARHQVPLSVVLDLAKAADWKEMERLPWGAPVFEGSWCGRSVRVAAYSEPSLLWELSHEICRSWNLMADGRCLASLEDKGSQVLARGLRRLQTTS